MFAAVQCEEAEAEKLEAGVQDAKVVPGWTGCSAARRRLLVKGEMTVWRSEWRWRGGLVPDSIESSSVKAAEAVLPVTVPARLEIVTNSYSYSYTLPCLTCGYSGWGGAGSPGRSPQAQPSQVRSPARARLVSGVCEAYDVHLAEGGEEGVAGEGGQQEGQVGGGAGSEQIQSGQSGRHHL